MNHRLVMCLFASLVAGAFAAAAAVAADWSLFAVLPVYSLTGSFTLVVSTLLAVPGEAGYRHAGTVAAERLARPRAAHA